MDIVFKALNDATRREILELLRDRDRTAGEIAEGYNISRPSISHHLDLLKRAGLVTSEKEGQYVFYSLNASALDEVFEWILLFRSDKNR